MDGEPSRSPAPPRPAAAPSPPARHLTAVKLLVRSLQRTPAPASRMRSPGRASAGPPRRSPGYAGFAAPPCPCAGCPARGGTSPFPRSPSPCGGSLTPRSPPHGSTASGAQPPVDTRPRVAHTLPEEGLGRPSSALHRLRRLAAPPGPCAGCPALGGTSPFPRSPSPCGGSLPPRSPPHGSTASGALPPVDTRPRVASLALPEEGLGRPSPALHRLRRLAAPPCPCAGCPARGGTSPFPRSPSPCGGSLTPRSLPHGSTASGAQPPADTRRRRG